MTRQLVFLGHAAKSYLPLIADRLATAWESRFADENDASRALLEADAVIGMAFDQRHRHARKVRLIQVPGAGCDRIDWSTVPKEATVCNVFEHEPGCAEYVLLSMLEWAIKLRQADLAIRQGDWSRSARFGNNPSRELKGQTVGIIGLGRIGMAVAQRAKAFGMKVLAVNRSPRDPGTDVDEVGSMGDLAGMSARADYIVVCCALVPETEGLVNSSVLREMKSRAVLINVARGPVVDEDAIWSALSEGRIGGAVLDVWWQNPPDLATPVRPSRHPFEELDNVVMSPHIAGWTVGTIERRADFMAANLDRLAREQALLNIVDPI